jgi:hypothetical protein
MNSCHQQAAAATAAVAMSNCCSIVVGKQYMLYFTTTACPLPHLIGVLVAVVLLGVVLADLGC